MADVRKSTPRGAGGSKGVQDHADELGFFLRTVGRMVRKHRMSKKLTQAQLAERVGLVRTTIVEMEGGAGNPSLRTLWGVASALEVPITHLVEELKTPDRRRG